MTSGGNCHPCSHAILRAFSTGKRLESCSLLHTLGAGECHSAPSAARTRGNDRACPARLSSSLPALGKHGSRSRPGLGRAFGDHPLATMSYLMNIDESERGIPTVSLGGTKTAEAALEIWTRLNEFAQASQFHRLLVIDEMDDEVTVWDVVDIEALLTSSNFPRRHARRHRRPEPPPGGQQQRIFHSTSPIGVGIGSGCSTPATWPWPGCAPATEAKVVRCRLATLEARVSSRAARP